MNNYSRGANPRPIHGRPQPPRNRIAIGGESPPHSSHNATRSASVHIASDSEDLADSEIDIDIDTNTVVDWLQELKDAPMNSKEFPSKQEIGQNQNRHHPVGASTSMLKSDCNQKKQRRISRVHCRHNGIRREMHKRRISAQRLIEKRYSDKKSQEISTSFAKGPVSVPHKFRAPRDHTHNHRSAISPLPIFDQPMSPASDEATSEPSVMCNTVDSTSSHSELLGPRHEDNESLDSEDPDIEEDLSELENNVADPVSPERLHPTSITGRSLTCRTTKSTTNFVKQLGSRQKRFRSREVGGFIDEDDVSAHRQRIDNKNTAKGFSNIKGKFASNSSTKPLTSQLKGDSNRSGLSNVRKRCYLQNQKKRAINNMKTGAAQKEFSRPVGTAGLQKKALHHSKGPKNKSEKHANQRNDRNNCSDDFTKQCIAERPTLPESTTTIDDPQESPVNNPVESTYSQSVNVGMRPKSSSSKGSSCSSIRKDSFSSPHDLSSALKMMFTSNLTTGLTVNVAEEHKATSIEIPTEFFQSLRNIEGSNPIPIMESLDCIEVKFKFKRKSTSEQETTCSPLGQISKSSSTEAPMKVNSRTTREPSRETSNLNPSLNSSRSPSAERSRKFVSKLTTRKKEAFISSSVPSKSSSKELQFKHERNLITERKPSNSSLPEASGDLPIKVPMKRIPKRIARENTITDHCMGSFKSSSNEEPLKVGQKFRIGKNSASEIPLESLKSSAYESPLMDLPKQTAGCQITSKTTTKSRKRSFTDEPSKLSAKIEKEPLHNSFHSTESSNVTLVADGVELSPKFTTVSNSTSDISLMKSKFLARKFQSQFAPQTTHSGNQNSKSSTRVSKFSSKEESKLAVKENATFNTLQHKQDPSKFFNDGAPSNCAQRPSAVRKPSNFVKKFTKGQNPTPKHPKESLQFRSNPKVPMKVGMKFTTSENSNSKPSTGSSNFLSNDVPSKFVPMDVTGSNSKPNTTTESSKFSTDNGQKAITPGERPNFKRSRETAKLSHNILPLKDVPKFAGGNNSTTNLPEVSASSLTEMPLNPPPKAINGTYSAFIPSPKSTKSLHSKGQLKDEPRITAGQNPVPNALSEASKSSIMRGPVMPSANCQNRKNAAYFFSRESSKVSTNEVSSKIVPILTPSENTSSSPLSEASKLSSIELPNNTLPRATNGVSHSATASFEFSSNRFPSNISSMQTIETQPDFIPLENRWPLSSMSVPLEHTSRFSNERPLSGNYSSEPSQFSYFTLPHQPYKISATGVNPCTGSSKSAFVDLSSNSYPKPTTEHITTFNTPTMPWKLVPIDLPPFSSNASARRSSTPNLSLEPPQPSQEYYDYRTDMDYSGLPTRLVNKIKKNINRKKRRMAALRRMEEENKTTGSHQIIPSLQETIHEVPSIPGDGTDNRELHSSITCCSTVAGSILSARDTRGLTNSVAARHILPSTEGHGDDSSVPMEHSRSKEAGQNPASDPSTEPPEFTREGGSNRRERYDVNIGRCHHNPQGRDINHQNERQGPAVKLEKFSTSEDCLDSDQDPKHIAAGPSPESGDTSQTDMQSSLTISTTKQMSARRPFYPRDLICSTKRKNDCLMAQEPSSSASQSKEPSPNETSGQNPNSNPHVEPLESLMEEIHGYKQLEDTSMSSCPLEERRASISGNEREAGSESPKIPRFQETMQHFHKDPIIKIEAPPTPEEVLDDNPLAEDSQFADGRLPSSGSSTDKSGQPSLALIKTEETPLLRTRDQKDVEGSTNEDSGSLPNQKLVVPEANSHSLKGVTVKMEFSDSGNGVEKNHQVEDPNAGRPLSSKRSQVVQVSKVPLLPTPAKQSPGLRAGDPRDSAGSRNYASVSRLTQELPETPSSPTESPSNQTTGKNPSANRKVPTPNELNRLSHNRSKKGGNKKKRGVPRAIFLPNGPVNHLPIHPPPLLSLCPRPIWLIPPGPPTNSYPYFISHL
ncbi:uncharacterized protein LOC124157225 isoform X2 [Ischnura elegans]|uniref:uncharacterized protein LOC124157225 isoform X2 n=1 Tax=Ischnura elegans TaxID=197161 RepID=UPI001ED88655|nr:uncharacterized protein LOC124157225 isoform X2 [Ischnura elegans]